MMPPTEKIRLGKDLRGGFSLVYALRIDESQDARSVMEQTISVLKDRVDPDGLFEISIVPQGRDRIEITMPLPNERVKALRAAYEQSIQDVRELEIDPRSIDLAMRAVGEERAAVLSRIAGDDAGRLELLSACSLAYDEADEARNALNDADAGGAPPEEIDRIVGEIAAAEIRYDTARDDLLATVLRAEELRRAIEDSDKQVVVRDDTGEGEVKTYPSPREKGLSRLRADFPGSLPLIESAIEAFDNYALERTALDDPSDLVRLLQGSGVLEFRITVDPGDHPQETELRARLAEQGPIAASASDARWFKINRLESWFDTSSEADAMFASPSSFFAARNYTVGEYDGNYYMLCWDTRGKKLTHGPGTPKWRVQNAYEGNDPDTGLPAIYFNMDAVGAVQLGNLTGENVRNRMAVLLDDEVYTAPGINSQISSSGIINGQFPPEELRYIIRTLNAGSLSANLSPEPIGQSVLGPDLGQDNLNQGIQAGIIAMIAVSVFMVFYYFQSGLLAVVALACNAVLIMGALALGRAALTLPGIAGIILTFGMAVDANVLIFERIREELRAGVDLKPAVRIGFDKALSSIVDGNVTNLIVCLVLANIGTQEIKGFAITLGIGVVSTVFSALVITRLLFAVGVQWMNWGKLPMLPTAVPAIERMLEPKIDWLRLRGLFIIVSACYVGLGIGMIVYQGEEMLDNEFRRGTKVQLKFKNDDAGAPIMLARPDVEERIQTLGAEAGEGSPIFDLRTAEILPVDPQDDGVTSDVFRIKTVAVDDSEVLRAIQIEFAPELESTPPSTFDGSAEEFGDAPIRPITNPVLGAVIGDDSVRDDVRRFEGGVAIMLRNLDPPPTLESLVERLERTRTKTNFSDTLQRLRDVVIVEGTEDRVLSAVILAHEEALSFFTSEDRWQEEVSSREWLLVTQALSETSTPISVESFSPTMAATFRARAIAAVALSFLLITIYIWVRFGAVRYSLAALAALIHDVLAAVGLIALAEILYLNDTTADAARSLGVLPFKIDLSLIAALLTIIGYSLNDSIIIMDRIRENRGKLEHAKRDVVNLSINQTISRTVITSGTTLTAVIILYVGGGEGVRAFSYALLAGVFVGTYSSIAVAAPLVWSRRKDSGRPDELEAEDAASAEGGTTA